MTRILPLHAPYHGLSSIVNVLYHVGPSQPNHPDDLKVVQNLLRIGSTNSQQAVKFGLPSPTGTFDPVTGFWIYHFQYVVKTRCDCPGIIIDGTVSPARGSTYMAAAPWTIVVINQVAKEENPQEYAAYVARVNAGFV